MKTFGNVKKEVLVNKDTSSFMIMS